MSLTLATDKKPSKFYGEDVVLAASVPQGSQRWMLLFKGFFLYLLPPNVRTHLMKEDISDPCKLAAKADEIWQ